MMRAIFSKFSTGKTILCREVDERSRIVDVKPVVVVEDADNLLVFWLPLGTPTKKPVLLNHVPGTPRRWEDGNWALVDGIWKWAEILIIVRPEDFRATWVRWSADRIFEGWYVNMQSKLKRTHLGFDLMDHQLDIVVDPDRNWQWKDQDELDVQVEQGRMTSEQAREIRAEGQRAVEEIEKAGGVFEEGWEYWQPDARWKLPTLTSNWHDLSMYHEAHRDSHDVAKTAGRAGREGCCVL